MGLIKIKESEEIKKEITDKVKEEGKIFLMNFEESFKKQKEELIEAICKEIRISFNNQMDTLYKEIKKEIYIREDAISADVKKTVNNTEEYCKSEGFLVKPGKYFG